MSEKYDLYRSLVMENYFTLLATVACVGVVAVGTGILHCLWGLIVLLNLNSINIKK